MNERKLERRLRTRTNRAEDARHARVILMLARDQQLGITKALENVT
jgi:hypothetical protein